MDSLWPKIELATPKSPVSILEEQASLLGSQTRNLVIAEVGVFHSSSTGFDTITARESKPVKGWREEVTAIQQPPKFRYSFDLVGPALDHYRYQLFTVSYGIELYP